MPSAAGEDPARLTTEWTHLVLVLLEGRLDEPEDAALVDRALRWAERSAKQVVVDLSGVTFMDARTLGSLLMPLRRSGALPWLAGPLSAPVARRLSVTGTAERFRIFPALPKAAGTARDEAMNPPSED
ncbi:STAS domain-containing protein [Streptomyces sp. NPDC059783]|uniref:STAS domain-containing protein n=1 Tax=Streptomyces sp. NPDC059783 TaxID=3346944 RepID=UPI003663C7E0